MRNEYWALKSSEASKTSEPDYDYSTSSIFSITAEEVEKDL